MMVARVTALVLAGAFCGLLYIVGSIPFGYWQAQHGFMAHHELGYPGGIRP